MSQKIWVETLGCPKNKVDSIKLSHRALLSGYHAAGSIVDADLIVVNTCAFIESARQESIDTIIEISSFKSEASRLVVTGCMAERYQGELSAALPEVDVVVGFDGDFIAEAATDVAVSIGPNPRAAKAAFSGNTEISLPTMDLLNLSRGPSEQPWAYLKVAEGCDRRCGFCAIPSFRGKQRSREIPDIVKEAVDLEVQELVLVAQDLASYGRDLPDGGTLTDLIKGLQGVSKWLRLLYIYPSQLTIPLIEAICASEVPYFDLSLQHVSRPLIRRMRRYGSYEAFLDKISLIRRINPKSAFRSSFIIGYPGESEEDHELLLSFLKEAQLDWAVFFPYSREEGTYSDGLDSQIASELAMARLREASELQDAITRRIRDNLVGEEIEVLIESPGVARSFREAPEIDGIVRVPLEYEVGSFQRMKIDKAVGPDLVASRILSGGDRAF